MADAEPTPTARVLMKAEHVRNQISGLTDYPTTPELQEDTARVYGPLLVEMCRLAIEQWRQCSPTPQPLSMTLIRMREVIQGAWAQEELDEFS